MEVLSNITYCCLCIFVTFCSLRTSLLVSFFFFFFSSRRRHTRSDRDWSSDVCSSDLCGLRHRASASAASLGSRLPCLLATPPPHPGCCQNDFARNEQREHACPAVCRDRKSVV